MTMKRAFRQKRVAGQLGEAEMDTQQTGEGCGKISLFREDAKNAELCNGRSWVFRSKEL